MAAREAYDRLLRDPERSRQTTLESFTSLPVPLEDHRARAIGVFFFPVGGQHQGRPFRPPYCRAMASLDSDAVTFLRVQPWDLGMNVEPGTVLGKVDDLHATPADVDRAKEIYFTHLDQVIASYDDGFTKADAGVRTELGRVFFELVFQPMLPAYRALSPRFVEWLETR